MAPLESVGSIDVPTRYVVRAGGRCGRLCALELCGLCGARKSETCRIYTHMIIGISTK